MQEVVFWKALINTSKFKRGHQKTWAKTDRCTVSPDEAASQLTQQELVFVVQYSDGIEIQHWHLTVAVHNGACACPQCRQRWAPWNAETGWCLYFQAIDVNGVHTAMTHFATATAFQWAGSAGTFWQADHTPISCCSLIVLTSFLDWTAIRRKW